MHWNLLYNTVLDLRSLYDAEYVIVPDDEHENTEAMDLARIKKNKKKKQKRKHRDCWLNRSNNWQRNKTQLLRLQFRNK